MSRMGERLFRLSCLGIFVVLMGACSSLTREELASLAAKGYYDHLIRGEYEQFLEGKELLPTSDDANFRSQLLENYRRFMSAQQTAHGGIREVRIVRAKTDSLQSYTNVFLTLCFGDSTNEEIVVPMVEKEGRWRMR